MIKRALSVTGTRIAATAAQGLTFLSLTQTLGPQAFGAFVAITVGFGLISSIVELGTGTLALRVQATKNPKALAASISVFRYIILAVTAGAVMYFSTSFLELESRLLLSGILFGAVEASYRPIENILFGFSRPGRAQASIVTRRFTVLAAVLSGFVWDITLLALNSTLIALLILSPLWLLGMLSRPLGLVSTVRLSLPYWGSTMLSKLQTLDVLIASLVVSPIGAGVYAAASRITSPLNILASSVLSILTPELSKQSSMARIETYRKSAKFLVIVCCSLIIFSPAVGWLLEWILGSEYQGVALPAAILCVSTGFAAINQGQVAYLYASGEAKRLFIVRLVTVPTAMLSAIPLGLAFGSVGVAVAVFLSQVLQVIVLRWQTVRLQKREQLLNESLEDNAYRNVVTNRQTPQ